MFKFAGILAVAVAVVLVAGHAAHASGCPLLFQLLGLCKPSGGGNPAPAPLLAAGIPAFTALGGGVLVTRLFRKRSKAG